MYKQSVKCITVLMMKHLYVHKPHGQGIRRQESGGVEDFYNNNREPFSSFPSNSILPYF